MPGENDRRTSPPCDGDCCASRFRGVFRDHELGCLNFCKFFLETNLQQLCKGFANQTLTNWLGYDFSQEHDPLNFTTLSASRVLAQISPTELYENTFLPTHLTSKGFLVVAPQPPGSVNESGGQFVSFHTRRCTKKISFGNKNHPKKHSKKSGFK